MDAVPPGGLGGTFGGNPLACAAAIEVLDEVASDGFRKRAEDAGRAACALAWTRSRRAMTRRRGSRARADARSRAGRPQPELAKSVTSAARDRGLVLLSCGIYGNVIRILVPPDDRRCAPRPRAGSAGGIAWRRPRWLRRTRRHIACLRQRSMCSSIGHSKTYGDVVAVDRVDLEVPRRRVLHAARPLGLGQDDDAAADRRLRAPGRGARAAGRGRRDERSRRTRGT